MCILIMLCMEKIKITNKIIYRCDGKESHYFVKIFVGFVFFSKQNFRMAIYSTSAVRSSPLSLQHKIVQIFTLIVYLWAASLSALHSGCSDFGLGVHCYVDDGLPYLFVSAESSGMSVSMVVDCILPRWIDGYPPTSNRHKLNTDKIQCI